MSISAMVLQVYAQIPVAMTMKQAAAEGEP
jgi:hypothetical protein